MSDLKFIYGVMGSSKSAQALITRHNYIQKGFNVILCKPDVDNRGDSAELRTVSSRIGIEAKCLVFTNNENLIFLYMKNFDYYKNNILIVDEAQFCTAEQIDQLKILSKNVKVICYGLKTNFKSELFEGSKRLIEIADELEEISYICRCGSKAIINARFINRRPTVVGSEILIGAEESYEALCYECWKKLLNE